jgi:esterase/lipase/1-acyl-sn-glycerol-3-phosphate acyltransferase
MNRSAYLTTGLAIKALSGLSRARVRIHGAEGIPRGSVVFAINHFTRIETLLLPYHIFHLTGKPVWSLADAGLFKGVLAAFLTQNGAVSTTSPDRDRLIVKSLLTAEASWVIFPEGRMVKNKKIYAPGVPRGRFVVAGEDGDQHAPHTGAATLALRTEFYRQRMREMARVMPGEALRLAELYGLPGPEAAAAETTWIVPVNLTYYPLRARENVLSQLARIFIEDLSERVVEEIMTEGTMLLAGVDLDIRFGAPIPVAQYLKSQVVRRDISLRRAVDFDEPIDSRAMLRKTAQRIMERYMSAIYRMTTVNHDHLFAAILGFDPAPAIDEADLRRRVFLAATTIAFDKMGIHRHPALLKNPVPLLTDDRHGQAINFLSLAEESGIVRREAGGKLIKADRGLGQVSFHRARLDDPINVMINEIEPLEDMMAGLKDVAGQPALRVRYRVGRWLREGADLAYERAWGRFDDIADRSAENVGRPLLRCSAQRRLGVLVIHGYMAAPLEVAELVTHLGDRGYWVYAPRLCGHGTAPEDLAASSYADWVTSVDEGYALLASRCRQVVVGGFSTGAGLALDLAARGLAVAGVFAVCPPFSLQDFSSRFAPAVDMWNKLLDRVHMAAAKKEFVENHPENPHINYKRNPIRGVRELSRLMDGLDDRLGDIAAPTLVVQSLGDPVVNYRGAWRLFNQVGTEDKEFFVLHFNRHGILLGEGAERVHRAVAEFLTRVAPP